MRTIKEKNYERFQEMLNLTLGLIQHFDDNNINPNKALDLIACYLAGRWAIDDDFADELNHLPVLITQIKITMLKSKEELSKK